QLVGAVERGPAPTGLHILGLPSRAPDLQVPADARSLAGKREPAGQPDLLPLVRQAPQRRWLVAVAGHVAEPRRPDRRVAQAALLPQVGERPRASRAPQSRDRFGADGPRTSLPGGRRLVIPGRPAGRHQGAVEGPLGLWQAELAPGLAVAQ